MTLRTMLFLIVPALAREFASNDTCFVTDVDVQPSLAHANTIHTGLVEHGDVQNPVCVRMFPTSSTKVPASANGCNDCENCMHICAGRGYANFCCFALNCCCYPYPGPCHDSLDCPVNMCH